MSAPKTTLPAIGAEFEGGIYAGVTCNKDGAAYALVLLADKPATDLTWSQAIEWATGLGAELPTRVEGALLFQNLRGEFAKRWHWLSEQHEADGSYAWGQDFSSGYQVSYRKDGEFSALAVRRFDLQSFGPLVVAEAGSAVAKAQGGAA